MTAKRALLEQLIADGVQHIFGNPGTTEQGFMDILQDYPQVQFMLALHEGVAVCMADAYARLSRRPSFVEVHIAPTTYTNWRARPDAAGLAEVADLLVKARQPMLMLGDSVALAEAQAEAARVAELLGAPMFECYASEFNISARHPLNLGSVDFV